MVYHFCRHRKQQSRRMAAKFRLMVVAVFLAACFVQDTTSANEGRGQGKPNYIVLFNKDTSGKEPSSHASRMTAFSTDVEKLTMNITQEYTTLIDGFSCNMTEKVKEKLESDGIYRIVPNTRVNANSKGRKPGKPSPRPGRPGRPGRPRPQPEEPPSVETSWGLYRIGTRDPDYETEPVYRGDKGNGVHIYVVDTGILASHDEFDGRVSADGFTAFPDRPTEGDTPYFNTDCGGHGTHVAGTAAGATHGVASMATLHSVQALDCDGSGLISDIIDGLTWIAGHRQPDEKSVVSMSLGGDKNVALDEAVISLIDSGVPVVVAAGNDGRSRNPDACDKSPAGAISTDDGPERSAITVGATTSSDRLASFSNIGGCVDILAPGERIKSAGYTSDTAFRESSGTSMACPHVSGVLAILLGNAESGELETVDEMKAELLNIATTDKVQDLRHVHDDSQTPNKLVFIGVESTVESGQNTA